MLAHPINIEIEEGDFIVGETNKSEDDDSESWYSSDSEDESSDGDESCSGAVSGITSDFLAKEEARQEEKRTGLFLSLEMVKMLRLSTSTGNLNDLAQNDMIQNMIPRTNSSHSINGLKGKMVYAIQTKSPMDSHFGHRNEESAPKPKDVLVSLMESKGQVLEFLTHDEASENLFVKGDVSGYCLNVMAAVKKGDVDYIRNIQKSGRQDFQCANRFGESIVHAAARQGHTNVLKFLVNEAGVSMNVRCDTGRTPLHDACWTGRPNFDCVDFILKYCPEQILFKDKRGFTPLEYAPKESHFEWKEFLENNQEKIHAQLKDYFSKKAM